MKKIITLMFAYAFVLAPVMAFAKTDIKNGEALGEVSTTFNNIISFVNDTLIPLVFAIALLAFLWGIFKYFILGGGDESKRAEGKQLMLWSIIGFVVMVSIFGIVNLVTNGLGLDKTGEDAELNIPDVPTRG